MRIISAAALAGVLVLALAGSALGAQPANQACFGKDVSTYATTGMPSHPGTLLPVLVRLPGPWGQSVQAHQAGFVPDDAITNSCNDPD